jgi:hypothetical protein
MFFCAKSISSLLIHIRFVFVFQNSKYLSSSIISQGSECIISENINSK